MAGSSTDSFALVKSRVKLSEFVGRSVKLKSAGGSKFRGPCPIHGGDNPTSLSVDDEKGLWKCFRGCGGGSVIDFWMKLNEVDDIGEAVESLASEAGVSLPEYDREREGVSAKRIKRALLRVAEAAADLLFDGDDDEADAAWSYLADDRKMDEGVIDEWMLGFIPSGRDGVDFILDASDDEEALIEGGVLSRRDRDDSLYSMYSGRLVFPILDAREAVIGFGGRQVPGVDSFGGKYVNPTDTKVYRKTDVLYGMHLVGKGTKRAAVVEGYLDVIAINEAGDDGVVALAVCGTALTTGHVGILERTDETVMMFDGDGAGHRAMASSYWVTNKLGDDAYGLTLEGDQDPWDLFVEDPDALADLVSGPAPFLLDAAVDAKRETAEGDKEFDKWVSSAIASLSRSDHKDAVLRRAARLRNQPSSTYGRGLTESGGRRAEEADGSDAHLDPNMRLIVRRALQLHDDDRDAVFAAVSKWTDLADEAIHGWFPVTSEIDVDAFRAVASGTVLFGASREADRALAACMPDTDEGPEDISVPLRNLINILLTDAEMVCGVPGTPEFLSRQVLGLRRIGERYRDVARQPEVLAYALDVALDMCRWRRETEDG